MRTYLNALLIRDANFSCSKVVITPTEATPPAPAATEVVTTTEATPPAEAADTFVFGSSLLKGLDEKTLSKYSKNFKVFCHPGACVSDIYEDVEEMQSSAEYDTTKVSGVFLLCGGNDLEKLKNASDNDITFVFEDIEDLVDLTREVFPNAKIHLISAIPRRRQYSSHIRNMHKLNDWLFKHKGLVIST